RSEEGPQTFTSDPFTNVTRNVTVYLPVGTIVSNVSVTIPSNVTIVFSQGSIISMNAGRTLAINGNIEAPLTQIFAGAGSVLFGTQGVSINPKWWGAVGNGIADDTMPIQTALSTAKASASKHLILTAGSYKYSAVMDISTSGFALECGGTGERWRST